MNLRRILVFTFVIILAVAALPQPVMGAASGGNVESSAKVSNDRPSNGRIKFSNDDDPGRPGTQVSPVPDAIVELELVCTVDDGNGWRDIESGQVDITRPDGTAHGAKLQGAPRDGNGRGRPIHFIVKVPSDAPPGIYEIRFVATDIHGENSTWNDTFEVLPTLAFALDGSSIAFGSGPLSPGSTTHDAPASIGVRNTGNVLLDLRVSSTGLAASGADASISPDHLRYSRASDMASEIPLTPNGITDEGFDLAPSTTRRAYLDLHMPTGDEQYIPAAIYTGSITLGGVVG